MRSLLKNSIKYCLVLIITFNSINVMKAQNIVLSQDEKFEQLLNEKRKLNSSLTINNNYKIQIFSGDSESSKKVLVDFKMEFNNYDSTIIFNTPVYKVIVGNFKTRIEAERNFIVLKKKYPNSILIKPNK
ncbi:SPOR domain-containing protein [Flavobacterium sp.]|uniref:SPOR domain-containing protein n=1 Tax=Flavobacterium sp. TaxID=239 RepID=UPI003750EADF